MQTAWTTRHHLFVGMVIVGITLFVLLEVIVQLLPPHYNPLSQSESDLAVGPYGFLMALGFAIGGLLTFIFEGIEREYRQRIRRLFRDCT